MSALTPKTDVRPQILDVRFVPKADIQRRDEVSAERQKRMLRQFTRLARAAYAGPEPYNLRIAPFSYYSV